MGRPTRLHNTMDAITEIECSETDRPSKQPEQYPQFRIFSSLLLFSSLVLFAIVIVIVVAVSINVYYGAEQSPALAALEDEEIDDNQSCPSGRIYFGGKMRDYFPSQDHRTGLYIQLARYERSRPIFKHKDRREYMFYMIDEKGVGYWVVRGGVDDVGMRVQSDALHPVEITVHEDWMYRENINQTWELMYSILPVCVSDSFVACSSGRLLVTGSSIPTQNGAYFLTNITQSIRPVYEHEVHRFVYIYSLYGAWFIGHTLREFKGTFNVGKEPRPELITSTVWYSTWNFFTNGLKDKISVTCHPHMIGSHQEHVCERVDSCSNRGRCISLNRTSYLCDCDEGFIGKDCEIRFSCGLPPASFGVFKTLTGTGFLAIAFYDCLYPSRVSSGESTSTCGADGKWSYPELTCP